MEKKYIGIFAATLASVCLTSTVLAENDVIIPENAVLPTVDVKGEIPSEKDKAEKMSAEATDTVIPVDDKEEVSTEITAESAVQTVHQAHKANSFTVDFTVEGSEFNADSTIRFALYDGNKLIGEQQFWISTGTKNFSIKFDVPEYEIGKKFTLVCIDGAYGMRYYDDYYQSGAPVELETCVYTDEYGNDVTITNAALNIITYKEKNVNIYVDGKILTLPKAPHVINGIVMVPVRETSEAMGVNDISYNAEYNSVRVAVDKSEILFNVNSEWTTVNGKNIRSTVKTRFIDGSVYVPIDILADGVAADREQWEHDAYFDVMLTRSKYAIQKNKVNYVNGAGLKSQTDYLIWVSKANYEVNVFKNSSGVWNYVTSFKCAIGTNSTPTCVGTYRYYEKIARWPYPNFYVGPVMRFNGGYAIHSTLLKYDGTDYNRTVGKKLSHGCVRVQPPDMDWLINNIPMYTTVHVTNE